LLANIILFQIKVLRPALVFKDTLEPWVTPRATPRRTGIHNLTPSESFSVRCS